MPGLTYDAGALLAAERANRRLWALHDRAMQRGVGATVPAVVVAQAWRGGPQHDLVRFLDGCEYVPFLEADAHRIGAILARSRTANIVDATVVHDALSREHSVVTSDRGDLEHIARSVGRRLDIIDV